MDEDLIRRLESIDTIEFQGNAWRSHRSDRSARSGQGAKINGGRFNPSGVETLYLGTPEDVALAEFRARFEAQGVRPKAGAYTLTRFVVDLERVVDLRDGTTLDRLGLADDTVIQDPHPTVLKNLGASADYLGFDAVIARSARAQGDNLAVYLRSAAAKIQVCDDQPI